MMIEFSFLAELLTINSYCYIAFTYVYGSKPLTLSRLDFSFPFWLYSPILSLSLKGSLIFCKRGLRQGSSVSNQNALSRLDRFCSSTGHVTVWAAEETDES